MQKTAEVNRWVSCVYTPCSTVFLSINQGLLTPNSSHMWSGSFSFAFLMLKVPLQHHFWHARYFIVFSSLTTDASDEDVHVSDLEPCNRSLSITCVYYVWRHRSAILKVSLHRAVNWTCTELYNKDRFNLHTGETDANQVDTVLR